MNCIVCDRPAHGMCRFCSRALCKDHFKTGNYIIDIYSNDKSTDKALVIENVLKCEFCNPVEKLVDINLNDS